MINLKQISPRAMQNRPFRWASISNLYSRNDAAALASTFPHNYFKTVVGNDGEKRYEYQSRSLVPMGKDEVFHPEDLSPAWLALAQDLYSKEYRAAMSAMTGYDLMNAPLEVNIFHYSPGSSLGPHLDL